MSLRNFNTSLPCTASQPHLDAPSLARQVQGKQKCLCGIFRAGLPYTSHARERSSQDRCKAGLRRLCETSETAWLTLHPSTTNANQKRRSRKTLFVLQLHRREPLRRPVMRSDTLGKSRRRTAYPQQIVTTRLLYCLQDRFAQLSRLQRI